MIQSNSETPYKELTCFYGYSPIPTLSKTLQSSIDYGTGYWKAVDGKLISEVSA